MEQGHQPDPRDRLRGVKGKVCAHRGPGGDRHATAPGPAGWEQGAWRSPRCPLGGPALQVCDDGCVASECRGHSPGPDTKARSGRAGPKVLNAAPEANACGAQGARRLHSLGGWHPAPPKVGVGRGGGRARAGRVRKGSQRRPSPVPPLAPPRPRAAPRPPQPPRRPVHLKGSADISAPPPPLPVGWDFLRRRRRRRGSCAASSPPRPTPARPRPAPPARPRGGMRRRGAQDAPQPRDAPQTRQVHPGGHGSRAAGRFQHPVLRVHVSPPRHRGAQAATAGPEGAGASTAGDAAWQAWGDKACGRGRVGARGLEGWARRGWHQGCG